MRIQDTRSDLTIGTTVT